MSVRKSKFDIQDLENKINVLSSQIAVEKTNIKTQALIAQKNAELKKRRLDEVLIRNADEKRVKQQRSSHDDQVRDERLKLQQQIRTNLKKQMYGLNGPGNVLGFGGALASGSI